MNMDVAKEWTKSAEAMWESEFAFVTAVFGDGVDLLTSGACGFSACSTFRALETKTFDV